VATAYPSFVVQSLLQLYLLAYVCCIDGLFYSKQLQIHRGLRQCHVQLQIVTHKKTKRAGIDKIHIQVSWGTMSDDTLRQKKVSQSNNVILCPATRPWVVCRPHESLHVVNKARNVSRPTKKGTNLPPLLRLMGAFGVPAIDACAFKGVF